MRNETTPAKEKIKLSIMIPAVLDRLGSRLIPELYAQIEASGAEAEVEVLVLYDNRKRSTGLKRQILLDSAQGKFVTCLDDDDWVAPDYVQQIVGAIGSAPDADVIAFNSLSSLNDESPFLVRTSVHYENEQCSKDENGRWRDIRRKPWHWCAWNARLAKTAKFPDGYIDDDWFWLSQMIPKVEHEHRIDKTLHYYQYNSKTSLSQQGKSTL